MHPGELVLVVVVVTRGPPRRIMDQRESVGWIGSWLDWTYWFCGRGMTRFLCHIFVWL